MPPGCMGSTLSRKRLRSPFLEYMLHYISIKMEFHSISSSFFFGFYEHRFVVLCLLDSNLSRWAMTPIQSHLSCGHKSFPSSEAFSLRQFYRAAQWEKDISSIRMLLLLLKMIHKLFRYFCKCCRTSFCRKTNIFIYETICNFCLPENAQEKPSALHNMYFYNDY